MLLRMPCSSAFKGHSNTLEHLRSLALTARLYAALIKMKVNGLNNRESATQLPVAYRRFDHEQLQELAACAEPSQDKRTFTNSATCLTNKTLRDAWGEVMVGSVHLYTYLGKQNDKITARMFPNDALYSAKRIHPTTTAAAFGRKSIEATTSSTAADGRRTHDPLRTAVGRGIVATMKGRKVPAPQTAAGTRSTVNDQTFSEDDLLILMGGSASGQPGMIKLLKTVVNKQKFIDIMEVAGIDAKDVGLNHALAYCVVNNFVTPEIAVQLRESDTAERKPADEMMDMLMNAQADPAAALRSMTCSTLKVLLVTLLVSSFDGAMGEERLSAARMTQGAFNPNRKTDVKNFKVKAEKVLTCITILLNQMDPKRTRKSEAGFHRAFVGVQLALDPTGGVVDKTLDLLNKAGMTPSANELSEMFQEMTHVLTPYITGCGSANITA